ncbi:hypothetical protein [Desulfuribacillus alkaliarsenatis]|uniref:Uncharacterized protein n=1 Tax=Desulfuribacillus alkaliarsenatis TaxID=766136 RepID=A0A1E5FZU3_9FIRM|nr:hypothetical protein [Desulfuribacillus alkaliarsenatis]OEF96115.1 hypothetical protein BHF68_10310 [Desulfuribacillus alkaliarsenatis]
MGFLLGIPMNIIEVLVVTLSWSLIIYLMYYFYQKQEVKPKIWKVCIALLGGFFTLDFNFPILNTLIKMPILPLGVWMLYWYASSREGAWDKYRRFAWLGFSANFIFIAAIILSIFLHSAAYPKSNISTYIAHYEEAVIIQLHPSAAEVVFDKESFDLLLPSFEEEQLDAVDWYNDMLFLESHERVELFPYYLSGTTPKWGSGLLIMIYVEKDGKGVLIDSVDKQRYFRSHESLLKGGNNE